MWIHFLIVHSLPVREAAKKVLTLMGGPLRPNPPPSLELNGRRTFETLEKGPKKSSFFLKGPALYPPPTPS